MPRTDSPAVEALVAGYYDSNISLTPFIETANWMVTRHLADLTTSSGGAWFDATDLELIERWLAAHFYAVDDSRPTSEGAGSVREGKQSKVDLGLDVTHFGQQAMRLDDSGTLAALNNRAKKSLSSGIQFKWWGKPKADQDADVLDEDN